MISTSAVIFLPAQKFSISCVSGMPPIAEPAKWRRLSSSGNIAIENGFSGAPTLTNVASRFSKLKRGGEAPFVAREMQIGVADPAKQNLDFDVLLAHVPAIERMRGQRFGGGLSDKAGTDEHERSLSRV
jgi:hypothetical protein